MYITTCPPKFSSIAIIVYTAWKFTHTLGMKVFSEQWTVFFDWSWRKRILTKIKLLTVPTLHVLVHVLYYNVVFFFFKLQTNIAKIIKMMGKVILTESANKKCI